MAAESFCCHVIKYAHLRRDIRPHLHLPGTAFLHIPPRADSDQQCLCRQLVDMNEAFQHAIYSANHLTTPQPEQSVTLFTDEETGFEQAFYNSAEEMPMEWNGFRIQPTWLPERFSFIQGSLYADYSVAIISASYTAEEDFFNLVTTFFSNDKDVSSYEYQKTLGDPITELIAGCEVTYYLNSDIPPLFRFECHSAALTSTLYILPPQLQYTLFGPHSQYPAISPCFILILQL